MSAETTSECPFKSAAEIDFMDPDVQRNPFAAYDVIREESPAYYMPQIDMFVITRYEDIEYVLRRPTIFTGSTDPNAANRLIEHPEARALYAEKGYTRQMPLGGNPPMHGNFRALVEPAFTASAIKAREGFVRGTINHLIDDWIDEGEVDFMERFAVPLPMIVIAELLGFPREDLPQLKEWSYAWVLPYARGLTLEQEMWAVNKHIELQHYIIATLGRKRQDPKDDIISRLAHIEVEDVNLGRKRPLTDPEIIGITDHLLTGGNETTAFALSSGLWLLFRHPDIYRELQADPRKIKGFVEETLRIESPTQGLNRYVSEDTEIGGVPVPKGAMLNIRYGAGNHDPARFPNPDNPVLERKNAGRHLAFGIGEHVCPGATLSRLEQNWAWEILLERLRNMRSTPGKNDFTHITGMVLRALTGIHMQFDKADQPRTAPAE